MNRFGLGTAAASFVQLSLAHKAMAIVIALLATAVFLGGCDTGDWAKYSKHKNDVSAVRKGWGINKVLTTVGKPEFMHKGEDIGAGWEEWVYPTGSVVFYRLEVVAVQVRPKDQPLENKPHKENPEDILMKKPEPGTQAMEGFVQDEK